jgi:hypothetical protein
MSIFRQRSVLLIGMILASTLILGLPSRAAHRRSDCRVSILPSRQSLEYGYF